MNGLRILICPDKFKGTLTAEEVIGAVRNGILRARPGAVISSQALADGGEGSLDIVRHRLGLREHGLTVTGPLRRPVRAKYLLGGGRAFIESAEACGLQHVPAHRRDPGFTTSIGVGQLIDEAIARGANEVNLFLGGSATNDAGAGLAAALGYRFENGQGHDYVPSGDSLSSVASITAGATTADLKQVQIHAICDVQNPLLGPRGSSLTYAVQKGATPKWAKQLEQQQRVFVERLALNPLFNGTGSVDPRAAAQTPGAGAAGGLGFGVLVFLGGRLHAGFPWLAKLVGLEAQVRQADLIITGEGKIDAQTRMGKVVGGVGELAGRWGVPVLAVCGISELGGAGGVPGLTSIRSLTDLQGVDEAAARRNAAELLALVVEEYLSQHFCGY